MIIAGKIVLLMLSYFGYWEYFRKRLRLNVFLIPAFTIGVQFSVMFLPGLLNFLPEAAYCIYFGGLLLLVYGLRQEKWRIILPYLNYGYAFLGVMLLAVAITVNNQLVTWFDNFTHWAVVVKNMLAADRFPTFAQSAVGFMDYPLGSSTIIYYFCRMTSTGEGIQMLAQGFVMLCMILPVFAFSGKNSFFCCVFALLLTNILLCYNIPITELLVDTLLPLTVASTFLLIGWLYREKSDLQNPGRIWMILPMLLFTMNVKSSGILFVSIALLILLLRCRKEKQSVKPILKVTLVLLVSFFLWKRHCDYVFWNASQGQHAISLEYFQMRLSEKSPENLLEIFKRVCLYVITRKEVLWLLGGMACLALLTVWLKRDWKDKFAQLAKFSLLLYAVYSLSLAGMYMFSMGVQSALDMESIDRYIRTIDIALYLLMCAYMFALFSQLEGIRIRSGAGLLALAALVAFWGVAENFQLVTQTRNNPEKRLYLENILAEYGVARGFSYLVCDEEEVVKYAAYVCRFCLDTNEVKQIKVTDPSQMEIEKDYDYIIILDTDNPVIENWVAEHYPQQAGSQVIQCIK